MARTRTFQITSGCDTKERSSPRNTGSVASSPSDHSSFASAFSSAGLVGGSGVSAFDQSFVHLDCLEEVIAFFDMRFGKLTEDDPEELIDVGQNLNRVPRCCGAAPCLTPNGLVWLRKRERLLEGCEALNLQGVPQIALEDVKDTFFPSHLQNLSGNAFNGYNVMAIQFAMISAYEWPMVTRLV